MIKKYYDTDCNLGFLDGKTIAIMGYERSGPRARTEPARERC